MDRCREDVERSVRRGDETRVIVLVQRMLYLKNDHCTRVIKYHRHRGEWYWNLDGKSVQRHEVRDLLRAIGGEELMTNLETGVWMT